MTAKIPGNPAPANAHGYSRRALLGGLGAGLLLAGAVLPAPALAGTNGGGLFGFREIRRAGLRKFPKWRGTLRKYFDERELLAQPCRATRIDACRLHDWSAFLDGVRARRLPPLEVLQIINIEMNRRAYILDPINWNRADYWASPGEFLRKAGDCEDFGIAKFMSLRALGFGQAGMRVVVLDDLNLGVAHAVLAVDFAGDTMILDNQADEVVSHRRVRHYRPIYAVNETDWWLYLKS